MEGTSIYSLPNEIIYMILQYSQNRDIVSFGSTCRRYNIVVNNCQTIWKERLKSFLPADLCQLVIKQCDGDYFSHLKTFNLLQRKVLQELLMMSSKYYWQVEDVTLEQIRDIFTMALKNNFTYYFVIRLLQTIVIKSNQSSDIEMQRPFTLTDTFYAKTILQYLMHTHLAVKWIQGRSRNLLHAEVVVNYFVQWLDTLHYHPFDEIERALGEMAEEVKSTLNETATGDGDLSDIDVLNAVSTVIYVQRRMTVVEVASLETLNIPKVLANRRGSVIAVAAIYQAVARKCGVKCDLIAFPNHLFLEWRDACTGLTCVVNIGTGELHPKRQCPYSQRLATPKYEYCPDSLIQYIYSSIHMSMAAAKDWSMTNALHLYDFLNLYEGVAETNHVNPYINFMSYLLECSHLPAMNEPINLKNLTLGHMELIRSLAFLNPLGTATTRSLVVKHHDNDVKFAAGMICYNVRYDYVCVIRGWDLRYKPCRPERQTEASQELRLMQQPFYHVVVVDQSERYVAQEHLIFIKRTPRLYHLEDIIAREFSHFDGFAYVPNFEKKVEYPDDYNISQFYKNRLDQFVGESVLDHLDIPDIAQAF